MQSNRHVRHTDAHTKHNLTGIFPRTQNISRSIHNNTHTKNENMQSHLMKILKPTSDRMQKLRSHLQFICKGRSHVFLSRSRLPKTAGVKMTPQGTMWHLYSKSQLEEEASVLQSQGVKDLLFEKVYIIMLFSI